MTTQTALKIHSAFGAIREEAYRINNPRIIQICNDTLEDCRELETAQAEMVHGLPVLRPITTVLAPAPKNYE